MKRLLWPAVIAAGVFAAYAPAMRGDWLWDDGDYVTENAALVEPGGLARIWKIGETPQYYPVTFTSFWVERRLWGLRTEGYHAVNAALHAANAVLALSILSALGFRWAWLAALLFALHPVMVESVAWITERKNTLSGFFYLLSLRAWLSGRGGWSLAAFTAALLSKSTACTLPVTLLLLRWRETGRLTRRDWREAAPYLGLAAAMGLVTIWVELLRVGADGPDFALSPLQRLLLACRALWFYAEKLVWPFGLAFSYERWRIDPTSPAWWLPLAACAAAALALRRAPRGVQAAVLFFAATLFPALGFFKIYPQRYSYVADHFQYLAALGGLILVAAGVDRLSKGRRWPGLALAAFLGALTWRQAHAYKSPEALWRDTLSKNPDSHLALANYGDLLHRRGQTDAAIALYRRALELKPDLIETQNNLANALAEKGRLAEAIVWYERALLFQPSYAEAHNNLGLARLRQGRPLEAARSFEKALALKPHLTGAHYNLGLALAALGRRDEAARRFERVLAERPDYEPARRKLAEVRRR